MFEYFLFMSVYIEEVFLETIEQTNKTTNKQKAATNKQKITTFLWLKIRGRSLLKWYLEQSVSKQMSSNSFKNKSLVEGNPKAPFSIATTPGLGEGATPFPG